VTHEPHRLSIGPGYPTTMIPAGNAYAVFQGSDGQRRRIVLVWSMCHHQKVTPQVIGIHGYVIIGGQLSCAEAQDSFSTYESQP
jgi:hypothetical protein